MRNMIYMRCLTISAILFFLTTGGGCTSSDTCEVKEMSLLAFPGAQGFGANTIGGRGGTIISVTNLNDSGPGSFREACETPGPRIVIFKTGGTIKLKSSIRIMDPFITIAGQTAPGDGITIAKATLIVSASEVIIRGIRMRIGSNKEGDWDGIALIALDNKPVRNVIVDHCSVSWSIDENVSTNGLKSRLSKVTFSSIIISEGLNDSNLHSEGTPHSAGMLINQSGVDSVSIIRNLFAHNKMRQPKIGFGVTAEIVNNVMYNWQTRCTTIDPESKVNVIGNRYIPGPDWDKKFNGIDVNEGIWPGRSGKVYIMDNIGPGRESNDLDPWEIVSGPATWKADSQLFDIGTPVISVDEAFQLVMEQSGAWPRDDHDDRIVQDVKSGTGRILLSEVEVGGLLNKNPGTAPEDSDGDEFPDYWELQVGLDPNKINNQNEDSDCNGYADFEDYINSFFP